MTLTDQRMVLLDSSYPREVRDWVGSYICLQPELQSEQHKRIISILKAPDVIRSARRVLKKISQSPEWSENFFAFVDEVARLPDQVPTEFFTPKEAAHILREVLERAKGLKLDLEQHASLVLFDHTAALIDQLTNLIRMTDLQLVGASNPAVGPQPGRFDGSTASRRWLATQVGTLAQVYLGDLHPVFSAAVTRALLGLRSGMTESNMRDLFPVRRPLDRDID